MDAIASVLGPSLTTLTLGGTAVTGSGLSRIAGLSNLRSLFLTGTKAAQEGGGRGRGGGGGGGGGGDGGAARASLAVESPRASPAALNIRL